MNDDDSYFCEVCEDSGYIEIQEGKFKRCPFCNKKEDRKKNKDRELDDY